MAAAVNRQASPFSHRVLLEGVIELQLDPSGDSVVEHAVNLSTTGMFVRTRRPSPPGTPFTLEAHLTEDRAALRGTAQVVWIRRVAEGPERPAGMGVRFLELEPFSREEVRRVIERCASAGEPLDWDAAAARDAAGEPPPRPAGAALGARRSAGRRDLLSAAAPAALAVAVFSLWWALHGPTASPISSPPTVPAPLPAAVFTPPATPPQAAIDPEPAARFEVSATLVDWADAWERQDLARYLALYSDRFRAADRARWERRRRARVLAPGFIRIAITGLETELAAPDRASLRFTQSYRSDSYSDTVDKLLELEREDDGIWRIVHEATTAAGARDD